MLHTYPVIDTWSSIEETIYSLSALALSVSLFLCLSVFPSAGFNVHFLSVFFCHLLFLAFFVACFCCLFSLTASIKNLYLYVRLIYKLQINNEEFLKTINCFSFTAESEREREEWVEDVQESIVETLSNYEVAEKIWFNQSNRSCADCRASHPEWASINLGVVICKMCAGTHMSNST